LERVNQLKAFQIMSICEGHPAATSDSHGTSPHIKLRLREAFLPQLASRWDQSKLAVVDAVARLFQTGDTYVNLELKLRLRASAGRLDYQETLVARIHRRAGRRSVDMDPDTALWLGNMVDRVEQLDGVIVDLWEDSATP
jgi:hypothetical protein